jgi:hypothetical protein
MEGVDRTKVKHTHSGHTLRHPPLKFNSNINDENQDCKIGTVCAWGGEVHIRGVKERRR